MGKWIGKSGKGKKDRELQWEKWRRETDREVKWVTWRTK